MNYYDTLQDYRSTLIQLKQTKRQLEALASADYGNHAACREIHRGGNQRNDRTAALAIKRADCQRKLDNLCVMRNEQKQRILKEIRDSNNPDLMKALYWRNVCRLKWNDICERLNYRHTCVALRQAASRYMRRNGLYETEFDEFGDLVAGWDE